MRFLKICSYIFLFLCYVNTLYAQGPSFNWAKSIGSPLIEQKERTIALDKNSNIYISGKCDATFDFDPSSTVYTVNTTNGIGYLAKYDSLGNFLWVKNFGPPSTNWTDDISLVDVKIDKSGNVLVGGSFYGNGDFDPSVGGVSMLSFTLGPGCPLLVKFDSNGNLLTVKILGNLLFSSNGYRAVKAIDVDKNNNIIVTGAFSGVLDFDPSSSVVSFTSTLNGSPTNGGSFLAKYDSLGNYFWAKDLGVDKSNTVAVDTNGTVYLGGTFAYTRDFNPSTSTFTMAAYGNSNDIFMSKFTSSGNFVTAVRMGDSPDERCQSLVVDKTSHVYIAGSFGNIMDFDPSPTAATNLTVIGGPNWVTTFDVYIAKYDSSLNLTWARNNGGTLNDFGNKMVLDKFNNSLVIGTSDNGNYIYTSAILLKYDVNGNYISKTDIVGNNFTHGYGIAVDSSGMNVYAQGLFQGTTDFNPYNPTYTLSAPIGNYDCFLVRFKPCVIAGIPTLTSSANNLCPGQTLTLSVTSGSLNGADYWGWHAGSYTSTTINSGTSMVISPMTNTVYYVLGEGGCSYSLAQSQSITVSVLPSPTISISGPSYICLNDTATLVSSGAITYTWNNGVNSSSLNISPSSATYYTVSGQSNVNNCISQQIFYISVIQPGFIPLYFSNYPICSGVQNTITAMGVASCTWGPGVFSNPLIYTFTSDTVFQISGINNFGCPAFGTNSVIVKPSPIISIAGPLALCLGDSTTLIVNGNATSYSWNTGALGNQITVSPTSNTFYIATGSATNGCYSTVQKNMSVNPLPVLSLNFSKDTACIDDSKIDLFGLPQGGVYSGSNVTGNTFIIPQIPGSSTIHYSYSDTITGCSSDTSAIMYVDLCSGLLEKGPYGELTKLLPNPNNGTFYVISEEIGAEFELIDLNGKSMYQDLLIQQKNRFNLENLSKGVYIVKIKLHEKITILKLIIE